MPQPDPDFTPPRCWFPAKTYGWGWGLPSTWEGWVVLAVYLALLALCLKVFPPHLNLPQRARALRQAHRDLLVEGRASEVAVGVRTRPTSDSYRYLSLAPPLVAFSCRALPASHNRGYSFRWSMAPGVDQMCRATLFLTSKAVPVVAAALLVQLCTSAYALDPDSPAAQREAEKMRAVLEENFQACNEENLKKLMGTTSRFTGTPQQMAEFAAEAKRMFEDTDVYMRLVDFELIKFQPPRAYAKVTQLTLPADEKGTEAERGGRKLGTTNFRSKSALLPEYELSSYTQRFNFENGKWKVHRVVSEPAKAEWPKPKD